MEPKASKMEPGAWKMEPEIQYPETGVTTCVGQARGRAGPSILIDVRPMLVGTQYLRQRTQAIENN